MAYIISGGITSDSLSPDSNSTAGETVFPMQNVFVPGQADEVLTVTNNEPTTMTQDGDILLPYTMPEAEYMYGCTPTAVGMILGYYDLYGYRGADLSAMIDGDVDLKSRGTDGNSHDMNAFDTVLGRAIATENFVYRFHSRNGTPTTPEEELEYSFTNDGAGPDIRTDVWDCIADYLGTGQYWRGNRNYSTTVTYCSLEDLLTKNYGNVSYTDGVNIRTIKYRDTSMMYGLYLYVLSRGYQMDLEVSGSYMVDCYGGRFTFEDYMYEIDSNRPVLISIEGHSMAGYGYNAATREIIFDDCYESGQRMVWDGTYNYADADRRIQSITVIGINVNGDMDLALVNPAGSEEKVILAGSSGALASEGCCFAGTTVCLTYSIRNTGTKESGDFWTAVRIDGDLVSSSAINSLSANSTREYQNVSLGQLDVGMHTVRVTVDENNDIQELSGTNNVAEGNILVLKPGTSIVSGTKTVGNGETASDTYVQGSGKLILNGGRAFSTILRGIITSSAADGRVWFYTGKADVRNGGCLSGTDLYDYGEANVSSGGTATDTRIFAKGRASVFDGGIASNTTIESGGTMRINAGGKVTGLFHVAKGASATFYDGSILDFDLTQVEAGGETALVNDLSIIKGTPLYTLTVDENLEPGNYVYTLAEGASEFDSTITVVNKAGDELGMLAVGETVRIGYNDYTLNLMDSTLSVTIEAPDLTPQAPTGTAEKVSWDATGANAYLVEYSTDNFEHAIQIVTPENAVDLLELPTGTYQWRVKADANSGWAVGETIVSEQESDEPKIVKSNEDGNDDLFFAAQNGTWGADGFTALALHAGSVNDWNGTHEIVIADGKGRIQNLFFGSSDPNVLCLTDADNGDAIFVDDVYTDFPEDIAKQTARLFKIQEIRAGAGDDIVDMTSQRFEYVGDGLTIRGGDGDDVIWANKGDNFLFGDAGDDRIIGASGNDVIAGGIGNDSMHGGGGNDIFTFCENWGEDTVEQLETGTVTLWFISGSMENWDSETLTYSDGENSVTVSGVSADQVTLKFEYGGSHLFATLSNMGAFSESCTKQIFDITDKGLLASL